MPFKKSYTTDLPMTNSSATSPAVDIQSFAMKLWPEAGCERSFLYRTSRRGVSVGRALNGAGKTTTIRTLLSLLDPTSGTLLVHGKRYTPAMASMVGYLPEERGLYRNEPVFDTMVYLAVMHGSGSERCEETRIGIFGARRSRRQSARAALSIFSTANSKRSSSASRYCTSPSL